MAFFLRVTDAVSRGLGWVAMALLTVLIAVIVYEVVARYAFAAPTIWAGDMGYMLSGSAFLLSIAVTLQRRGHVRIDFLSARLPARARETVYAAFYVVAFLPLMGLLAWVAVEQAWRAYDTGRVVTGGFWAPQVWPFWSALALGLVAFWLQVLAEAVRHALAAAGRSPAIGDGAPGAEAGR